ncbi:MAG: histone deacetylase [Candidatus Nezhaarchaeales archaeon]
MSNSSLCIVYDDVFLKHNTDPYHPERPQRLIDVMRVLKEGNVLSKVKVEKAVKASIDDVLAVHDEEYVKYVERAITSGKRYLDPDTQVSKESFEVALYAAGSAILGCKKVLEEDYDVCFILERPPGHHAGKSGAALGAPTLGFCLFNNVAIAAKYLVNEIGLTRIAIFDFDCHHGNGTQEIFYDDKSVLYISTHQDGRTAYPGTGFINEVGEGEGVGYNINIPLPPFTADDLYKEVLNKVVSKVLRKYKPEILLLSAGFDAHKDDPITSMNLSLNSFLEIAELVKRLKEEDVTRKAIFVLEGGYGPGLAQGVHNIVAYFTNMPLIREAETSSTNKVRAEGLRVISEVCEEVLKLYWGLEAC